MQQKYQHNSVMIIDLQFVHKRTQILSRGIHLVCFIPRCLVNMHVECNDVTDNGASVTCTTAHPKQYTYIILFALHQFFLVKSSDQIIANKQIHRVKNIITSLSQVHI